MKFHITIPVLLCFATIAAGQTTKTLAVGTASYVSSQHVYVKFPNTEGIALGDTLFIQKDSVLTAALLVKDKSTTSCVCTNLKVERALVGASFYARVPQKAQLPKPKKEAKNETPKTTEKDSLTAAPLTIQTPETEEKPAPEFTQKIKGRLSAASYSNFLGEDVSHRMRYTFTLQGNNLGNSRFSTDNYVVFRHTVGEWQAVKDNLNDAFKIYSLSVKYDLDKTSSISLGRRVNQRISSMGAIDGLQIEKGFGQFMVGAIAGSRPDFADFGLNFHLMQAGGYIGHAVQKGAKSQQTTLGFIEQHNGSSIDRRFVYFQHSNNLLERLSFFGSMELDLYERLNGEAKSKANLTNLLLTLRYKLSKKTSLSLSYDSRRNIIYYESYKNYIDQLIDNETRQGLRLNINYRPFKWVSWGANANWRFQKNDLNLSKNLNTYLNFSRVPWIGASASLTVNLLQTTYLKSRMYGVRLSRDLLDQKLNCEAYYRLLDYEYASSELTIQQQVAGLSFSTNLTKKLGLYLYYEGTFDKKSDTFHRVNTKLVQRF